MIGLITLESCLAICLDAKWNIHYPETRIMNYQQLFVLYWKVTTTSLQDGRHAALEYIDAFASMPVVRSPVGTKNRNP